MTAGLSLYNQSSNSDDDFVANFVAREDILQSLLRRLQATDQDESGNHHILIGTRGMGKSSLLRRLSIAVNRDKNLAALYIPLTFREEQYNVLTLGDFWRNCGESLAQWAEDYGPQGLAGRLDASLTTKAWAGNDGSAEQFAEELVQLKRRAVLLVDNLDLILDSLSDEDQWSLRRYLQARRGPIMSGAATRTLAQSAEREAAFYEFFQPHYLDPLNERETEQCMRALARRRGDNGVPVTRILNTQPERLRTLHTLTGGNPRVLTLIYRLLEASETDEAMTDLDILLDQVTPYYKARIEEYQTPQQRAVIDAIALHWDPVTVGALSQITNIAATTLSSLLIKFRKDGLIETTEVSSASAGHQITERFLNIWFLMRNGTRRAKLKLRWLVRFLTIFYSSDELDQISKKISAPDTEKYCHPDYRFAVRDALSMSGPEEGRNIEIYSGKSRHGGGAGGPDTLRPEDEPDQAALAGKLSDQAWQCYMKGDLGGALSIWDDIIIRFGHASEPATQKHAARALVNKGYTFEQLGDPNAAIATYDSVVARFGENAGPEIQEPVARALVNKGVALRQMGDPNAAIVIYDSVVARYGESTGPEILEQVARALVNKGSALGQMGDPNAAMASYNDLVFRFGNSAETKLREYVASARICLGNLSLDFGIDRVGAAAHLKIASEVLPLLGLSNLAWLHLSYGEVEQARTLLPDLKGLPVYGQTVLKAALAVSDDNFGLATDALASVLTAGLDAGTFTFEDDLNRLFWLIERKNYGERLITWFEETGLADQVTPIYVAFKAYILGEAVLLDVNPEVRGPAQKIYDQLNAPRRFQQRTSQQPPKPQQRRGRPRKNP